MWCNYEDGVLSQDKSLSNQAVMSLIAAIDAEDAGSPTLRMRNRDERKL